VLTTLVNKRLNLGDSAPIVEALLDFRVLPKDGLDISDLKQFGQEINDKFPDFQIQTRLSSVVSVDEDSIALGPISTSTLGYAYISPDSTRIAQVQVGGFSFSKLKPYEGWDPLYQEFQNLWSLYLKVAQPVSVERVAVRFINKIPLPLGDPLQPSALLEFHPTTPKTLVDTSEFFMRTVNTHPTLPSIQSIVIVASDVGTDPRQIIFDIDAFSANLSIEPRSQQLWDILLQLREYKNDLFFGSITPLLESLLK
jgi:uncharacterized protein (TIGR04255 family)